MDIINHLINGFSIAVTPEHLIWGLLGAIFGTAVGVLPGIGSAVTVAMLLPITLKVDVISSLIFFAGIYYGTMYGSSTASILLNSPNHTEGDITALEGNKMARNARAGAALATAAVGSFVAGLFASVVVTVFAPGVAAFATHLGPAEYFMLMVLALATVSAVLGQSTLRGITALFIGLALGCVGMDPVSGTARYAGEHMALIDGIDIVLVAVGLFAVGEVLHAALSGNVRSATLHPLGRVRMTREDWRRSWPAWLRGALIGTPFGCVPAGGTEFPTVLSYAGERRAARPEYQDEFGTTGAIEGVAGPEAANNATVTATLIPLLTLGIPTSNTTAILLSAFQNYGIHPGPQLFESAATMVWALIASLYIGNIILLILNLPLAKLWVKLLNIPKAQWFGGILIFAIMGAYGLRQNIFDIYLLLIFGILGVIMRRFHFPMTPVVVGMILGPLAETQMRNALAIGQGSFSIFLTRPMSLALIILVLALIIMPRVFGHILNQRLERAREEEKLEQAGKM